jgi:hypothetical protein
LSAPAPCAGSLAPLRVLVAFIASLFVASWALFAFFLLPIMSGRVDWVEGQRALAEKRAVPRWGQTLTPTAVSRGWSFGKKMVALRSVLHNGEVL